MKMCPYSRICPSRMIWLSKSMYPYKKKVKKACIGPKQSAFSHVLKKGKQLISLFIDQTKTWWTITITDNTPINVLNKDTKPTVVINLTLIQFFSTFNLWHHNASDNDCKRVFLIGPNSSIRHINQQSAFWRLKNLIYTCLISLLILYCIIQLMISYLFQHNISNISSEYFVMTFGIVIEQ